MDIKIFPSRLTLALPKQEKLKGPILSFLKARDFVIEEDGETGILFDKTSTIPQIRIEFVRAADALMLMERNIAQLAIIGSDVADERTTGDAPAYQQPRKMYDLDVATCNFQLAVPNKRLNDIETPEDLNGLRIATSYPNLLASWLTKNNVTPKEVLVREGGVESSIRMGLVDVVADIVDTGGTLRKNDLSAKFQIARTSAVCYAARETDVITDMLINEFVRELRTRSVTTVPFEQYEVA